MYNEAIEDYTMALKSDS